MDFKPLLQKAQEFLSQEKFGEALKVYQQILAEDPNHYIALQAMGQIASQVGNFEAAEDYFQKSLASNPSQYRIWLLLGEVCIKLRKSDKALQAYKNAITISPDKSEAYLRLGNAQTNIGNLEETSGYFEKAFTLDEASPSAFRRLNMVKKDLDPGAEIVHLAHKRLDSPSLDPTGKAHIHYGLAYLYERRGDREKFFGHLHKANALQKSQAPPWEYIFEQNAQSIKKNFTEETLSRQVSEDHKIFTPIFIIGMPRSGTTLTEQLLSCHPKVFGADEMDTLTRYVVNQAAIWTQKPLLNGINDLTGDQLNQMSLNYQTRMQKLAPGWPYITDKFLANYLAIGLIKMIMPWSKVILLERHPMDVALSIYRNFFMEVLPFCFDLKDMAKIFCLYKDLIAFWDKLLPGFTYTVRYETLVKDFKPEARKIIDFCGLDWDDACLEPHKSDRSVLTLSQEQVRQPVYTSSIGKWRKYERELEPFRQTCLQLGYNVDDYDRS